MEQNYYLYHSKDKKEFFSLPDKWTAVHFVESGEGEVTPSVEKMALDAVTVPIGSPQLKELISGAGSIAIIVDDATRPTPVPEIMKVIAEQLEGAGFSPEKVTIVVALGTHVVMSEEGLEARLGKGVASRYRIVQHNAWQSDLVPIQIPGQEKVVKINPEVAKADVKIAISSILPHPMAGYGGGPKIVMPGVCNFEYIREHHMRYTIHPQSVGGYTKGNMFHDGCMKVAKAVGLDFSINCVYNQQGEIIRIVAGSLEAAFTAATDLCFEKLGVRFLEKVDIAITFTYPHTHGVQFSKGLTGPNAVTREGGDILMVVPVVSPVPEEFIKAFDRVRGVSHGKTLEYSRATMP